MCLFSCCCSSSNSKRKDSLRKSNNRSCTDCLFLLFFLVFCGCLIATTVYGYTHGDAYKVLYGSDSFGNTCGRRNAKSLHKTGNSFLDNFSGQNMIDRKFMFPLNISNPFETIWSCVKECPRSTIISNEEVDSLLSNNGKSICARTNGVRVCPKLPVLKSVPVLHRCVPEDVLTFGQELVKKVVQLDFMRSYLNDLLSTYPAILKSFGISIAISFISIFLLRFFAGIIVYFIYALVAVISIGISCAFWYSFYLMQVNNQVGRNFMAPTTSTDITPLPEVQLARLYRGSLNSWFTFDNIESPTMLGLSVGASVISVFVIICVWCLLPRGKDIIELFERASKAISAMPVLLFQPVISATLVLILAAYSLSTVFVLLTAGVPVAKEVTVDGSPITIVENNVTEKIRLMVYAHLLGFVWISEFILACQRLFIAGSVSLWYFKTRGINDVRSPACASFYNLFRYHLGSAALGSLIITIVRFPRYLLMFTYAKMKAIENPIAKKLLGCFIVVLGCIERCLNYLNYNAYTVISYSGLSFCPSAKLAVNTLLDNAVGAASINTVGSLVLFLTKCMVATVTTVISFYIFKDIQLLAHPIFPFIIMFIISYLIANCFLSIFEMAVDSLFLCHLEYKNRAEQFGEEDSFEMAPLRSDAA